MSARFFHHGLPPVPPRGKLYAVARFTSATVDAELVLEAKRHDTLDAAEKHAATFDDGLTPYVCIVDKERAAA